MQGALGASNERLVVVEGDLCGTVLVVIPAVFHGRAFVGQSTREPSRGDASCTRDTWAKRAAVGVCESPPSVQRAGLARKRNYR